MTEPTYWLMIFAKDFLMENIDEVLLRVAHDREGVTWGWSKRCEPFLGTWTPADHVYFLHGSEGAVRLTSPGISI